EVYGLLLISLSIYAFIVIYYNIKNIIPLALDNLIKGLTGFGAYLIPFFIFFAGISFIIKREKNESKFKFYMLCSIFILFLSLIEINHSLKFGNVSFIDKISGSYKNGLKGIGGGSIGEILSYLTIKLLGTAGSYIFICTFILINVLLITKMSLYNILSDIKNKTGNMLDSIKDARAKSKNHAKKTKNDKNKDEDNEKMKYIDEVNKKIKILDFFKSSDMKQDSGNDINIVDGKDKIEREEKPEQIESGSNASENNVVDEIKNGSIQSTADYVYPPLTLLNDPDTPKSVNDKKELINNAKTLEDTLESFGVEARVVQVSRGPVITRYELQPSPGVRVSKIANLSDDIALNLAASAVRIEAPIPGKAAVGIEIPNKEMNTVYLKEIIESKEFAGHESPLTFALGKDVAGNCVVSDLAKMPHLLIAGATGSGKSVCVNAMITSLIYKSSPKKVRMLMIDPKVVELSTYNGIPHLLIPVVTDPKKAASALGWAVQEMVNRYKLFADNNVRNIESFNDLKAKESPESVLPKIVIIIDELSDLMMVAPNDIEDCICRLAQMARAAGMHLVVATQRPSVDVLTGVIKANIPSRISFAVSSQIDSRTILDMAGAEKLLGKGDMLYYPV
ncbi:MAG TPA: cell division protein FtsK, partial [Clostridiaceae bacterium]|nr:cell division protein FtsK [Clostridiaceae bacterium]